MAWSFGNNLLFLILDGLTTWSILLVFSGIIQDTVVIWQLSYGGWITNNLTHLSGAWKWYFWNGKRLAGFLFRLSFLSSPRSYFTSSLSSSKRLTSQGSLNHFYYILFIKTSHKAIPNSRGGKIGSNFDKKGKVILQRGMVGIITATLQIGDRLLLGTATCILLTCKTYFLFPTCCLQSPLIQLWH